MTALEMIARYAALAAIVYGWYRLTRHIKVDHPVRIEPEPPAPVSPTARRHASPGSNGLGMFVAILALTIGIAVFAFTKSIWITLLVMLVCGML